MTFKFAAAVSLMLAFVSSSASGSDGYETTKKKIKNPSPMRTEGALVYATPVPGTVLLEFKLYDNQTWCFIYMKTATWDRIEANGGELPADADIGSFQCTK